eukprot:2674048-Prymnesium_polylepis.1
MTSPHGVLGHGPGGQCHGVPHARVCGADCHRVVARRARHLRSIILASCCDGKRRGWLATASARSHSALGIPRALVRWPSRAVQPQCRRD